MARRPIACRRCTRRSRSRASSRRSPNAHPASEQIARLLRVLVGASAAARPTTIRSPSRERRARAAIVEMLAALAAVHAAHDDPAWTIDELGDRRAPLDRGSDVRRRDCDDGRGVHLLDDQAARYGDFDDVAIVGVVEQDWPERPRRNIFYPPALLEGARLAVREGSPRRRRRALPRSARRRRRAARLVSTFTLDDDALVSRSMQLDEIPRARLSTVAREPFERRARLRRRSAVARADRASIRFEGDARELGASCAPRGRRRTRRLPRHRARPAGARLVGQRARDVSRLPVQVLRAARAEARGGARRRRGDGSAAAGAVRPRRVRAVLRRVAGARATAPSRPQNLDVARELFAAVVDRALERLPAAEAGLERTRLLGSPAAAGLGEAVLRMEAERPDRRRRAPARAPARRATSRSRPPTVRGRSRCAARPIGSICSRTARSG